MRGYWPLFLALLSTAAGNPAVAGTAKAGAPEQPLARYAIVETAPVKTSIYLGSVTLDAGPFVRDGQTYTAIYTARVFPYFFFNEAGRMAIDVPDASLARLSHGQSFEFAGTAIRSDGRIRRLTGRIVPLTDSTGKIKVRLVVSGSLVLVFDSTYRLAGSSQ